MNNTKYKFTIEYYFSRWHTGELNIKQTRIAILTASNRKEALEKVFDVDDNFIDVASMRFEEINYFPLCGAKMDLE